MHARGVIAFALLGVSGLAPAQMLVAPSAFASWLADADASASEAGLALATAAHAQDLGFGDSRSAVRMVLHDGRGRSSERELRILELEGEASAGDRSLVLFDSPPDQRGTALLTWNQSDADDDQWLYLPALRRVKKIAARNRSGPFVGSEFAFEDLTAEDVENYQWRYLDSAECALGACYRVERVPVESWSGYSRQIAWYDVDALRLARVEYFDRKGEQLKTLEAEEWLEGKGGYWRAGYMHMENHVTGRRTELFWSPHTFGTGLKTADFSTNALRRAR